MSESTNKKPLDERLPEALKEYDELEERVRLDRRSLEQKLLQIDELGKKIARMLEQRMIHDQEMFTRLNTASEEER